MKNFILALLAMAVVIESSESVHKFIKSSAKSDIRILRPMDVVTTSRLGKLNQELFQSYVFQDVFSHHEYIDYDDENVEQSEDAVAQKERRLTPSASNRLRGHRYHHHHRSFF